MISLDILATIATLAEAPISEDRPLDGVNLIPYLTGENPGPPHSQLFWRKYNNMSRAIRQGNYKLVDTDGTTEFMELYDLAADIGERNLLAQREYATDDSKMLIREQPDQIYEMMKAWEQWSRDLKPLAFPTLGGDVWW